MNQALSFSQSCENNKTVILEVLKRHLGSVNHVLETSAGTGQHACFFADHFSTLKWQCSELDENLDSLNLRLSQSRLDNLPPALSLDVTQENWKIASVEAIFTANSLHIMPLAAVETFFSRLETKLCVGGLLLIYGPFKYKGDFTSESNARFDLWLKNRSSLSGIRDFETIEHFADLAKLKLVEDNAMPANNQLLVWRKHA
ncbi:MAG: methylase [SAR86 cluster bacterium]|uniref:Methylase n=1 Tax=SAR86 cluster bacterium TaxID=2030880 RepID=A0A2A4MTM2_9GAMM|nr:MAG: methylase [SAR86 cluster bacterium]